LALLGAQVARATSTVTVSTTHTFTTEITARMLGGALLFDQSFNLPFDDPFVQAEVLQAEAVLTVAGANSFLGPTLISEQLPAYVDTTVIVGDFGGSTIRIGDLGTCQGVTILDAVAGLGAPFGCPPDGGVPFSIAAGGIDFDTNVDSQTTQVYELDGLAANAVPEPSLLTLAGAALLLCAFLSRPRHEANG
jgi:hypothetical protein